MRMLMQDMEHKEWYTCSSKDAAEEGRSGQHLEQRKKNKRVQDAFRKLKHGATCKEGHR